MKIIEPDSPELRELKAKAIAELDRPLLAKIRAFEGEKFIYCEEFYDLVKSNAFKDSIPIIVNSELEELMKKSMSGG